MDLSYLNGTQRPFHAVLLTEGLHQRPGDRPRGARGRHPCPGPGFSLAQPPGLHCRDDVIALLIMKKHLGHLASSTVLGEVSLLSKHHPRPKIP